jgi:translation initiation factor 4G
MRNVQELSQQYPRSGDEHKRTIKITHPETHEELMLDRHGHSFINVPASGQMPLNNINQLPHSIQTFFPLQKVYYPRPGTYNSAHVYLPNFTDVPLASRQFSTKIQPSMHGFDSTKSNQPFTSIRPPMPISRLDATFEPLTNFHTASEISNFKGMFPSSLPAPVHVELKPPITLPAEKNSESTISNQQKYCKIGLEMSLEPVNLVYEGKNHVFGKLSIRNQ